MLLKIFYKSLLPTGEALKIEYHQILSFTAFDDFIEYSYFDSHIQSVRKNRTSRNEILYFSLFRDV